MMFTSFLPSNIRLSKRIGDILYFSIFLLLHFWILGKTKFIVFEEMFSYGWFIKKGLTLYRDVGVMYPPGIFYLLYFVYSVFGFTFSTFQGLVYTFIVLTDLILFIIARSWFGSRFITLATLLFYFMWHTMLDGKVLWFETMLTPALLIALYYFWKYKRENQNSSLIFSGLFFSIAVYIKQPSLYPLAGTILFILLHWRESVRKKIINIGYLLLFPVLSAIGTVIMFLRQGLLGDLFYWIWYVPTSVYARHGYYLLRPRRPDLYALLPVLLIFSIGLMLSVTVKHASRLRLLVLWGIAVSLFAYPRWANFHLLPLLTISSLIFGDCIRYIVQASTTRWIKVMVLGVLVGMPLALTVREIKHFLIDINPKIVEFFPQRHALLVEKIKQVTGVGSIYSFENVHLIYYMMDSAPTVLPWSPVTPILDNMPELADRFISQLSGDHIDYIVYFPYAADSLKDDNMIPMVLKRVVEKRYLLYKKEKSPEPFMIYKRKL